jgi:hypothetical protein
MTLTDGVGQRCLISRCPKRLLLKVSFGKLSILIEVFVYSYPHISHSCCDMGKRTRGRNAGGKEGARRNGGWEERRERWKERRRKVKKE